MDKTSRLTTASAQSTGQLLRIFFHDLKLLTKGLVLYANVLPVLAGFMLALYFTNTPLRSSLGLFLATMVGSILITAGALIINNWYEVDLDKEMKRTKERPTVTGNFSMKTVLWMGVSATGLGFLFLAFTTLEAAIYGILGWFTYVVLYTFWSKRKYTLNTMIGSVSGAFTPLIGWAAVTSSFHIIPIALFMLLFIWQIPHTFAIAMRRHDEYKAAGVPMLPVVHGFTVTKQQTFIYILCLLPIPFFLSEIGMPFVIIATVLNVIWIFIAGKGLIKKQTNDKKWADVNFFYSLAYLTILFFYMIITTFPIFYN
ncbi:MAG TPA: heme o synthase, partial [Bacillota bacterium]|nr:heme o synthase [Bacillota bacterium]